MHLQVDIRRDVSATNSQ